MLPSKQFIKNEKKIGKVKDKGSEKREILNKLRKKTDDK